MPASCGGCWANHSAMSGMCGSKAPGMPYAHPTVEHFSPLFVTLGAASDATQPGQQVIDGFWMGLSKRSLQLS